MVAGRFFSHAKGLISVVTMPGKSLLQCIAIMAYIVERYQKQKLILNKSALRSVLTSLYTQRVN